MVAELAEAAAYRASAEVMLAGLAAERDELAAELERAHDYTVLLQARAQGGAGSAAREDEVV